MRSVTGEQYPPAPERLGHPLMNPIDCAMDGFIVILLWHHSLETLFHAIIAKCFFLALIRAAAIKKAPKAGRAKMRQMENGAPLNWVGNVGGVSESVLAEIIWCADECEIFGIGKPVKFNFCCLADDASAAIGTNHPGSLEYTNPIEQGCFDAYPVRIVRNINGACREMNLGVRYLFEHVIYERGQFVLLAVQAIRIRCFILEQL